MSNSLQESLINKAGTSKTKANTPKENKDGVTIGGTFPKAVRQQLKILAAEEDTTNQDLLEEALNLLFTKKGKKRITELL